MKAPFIIILIALSFTACSFNNGMKMDDNYPQKWQLVEMSGSMANTVPSRGSDMAWQEYYLLYSDSTFVKSRKYENSIKEEYGRFSFIELPDGDYLELVHDTDNDLIGNCTSDKRELLKVTTEYQLTGTWSACDGPGLVYKRTK